MEREKKKKMDEKKGPTLVVAGSTLYKFQQEGAPPFHPLHIM